MEAVIFIPYFLVLFFSIILHEIAHGYTALKLGDPTAYQQGRLTMNPLPHIDPIGTIFLPLFLWISNSPFLFGWAKPVPVNPLFFRKPTRDMAIVASAGPLTNLIIASGFALVLRIKLFHNLPMSYEVIRFGVVINTILAVFNLIPIPPLDGSRILAFFLPRHMARTYARIEPFGFIIILLLLITGVMRWILLPLVNIILSILIGG